MRQVSPLSPLVFIVFELLVRAIRQRNKTVTNRKGKSQIIPTCSLFLKDPKTPPEDF
jgi:hypothetical protein